MTRFTFWCRLMTPLAVAALALVGFSKPLAAQDAPKPIRALLVIGGGYHDYEKQKDLLAKGIAARAHVDVTVAYDPDKASKHLHQAFETPNWAKGYDVVVHDQCSADVKDLTLIDRVLEPHRQGLPAVV